MEDDYYSFLREASTPAFEHPHSQVVFQVGRSQRSNEGSGRFC